MWVSQASYIKKWAVDTTIDHFQGIFWSIYMFHFIIGNGISYLFYKIYSEKLSN